MSSPVSFRSRNGKSWAKTLIGTCTGHDSPKNLCPCLYILRLRFSELGAFCAVCFWRGMSLIKISAEPGFHPHYFAFGRAQLVGRASFDQLSGLTEASYRQPALPHVSLIRMFPKTSEARQHLPTGFLVFEGLHTFLRLRQHTLLRHLVIGRSRARTCPRNFRRLFFRHFLTDSNANKRANAEAATQPSGTHHNPSRPGDCALSLAPRAIPLGAMLPRPGRSINDQKPQRCLSF